VRALGLAVLLLALPSMAWADEPLWTLLKGGRQVVLVRHGLTTPGVGDPPGFRLEDCATQRNLNDEGRRESRRLGEEFRTRGIPVARVLSSPWCRCVETARLAFGGSETWTPLSNLFGRPENREAQVRQMRARMSEPPQGGNLILVTHGSTIAASTGVNPDTAEMVVVTPLGQEGFTVAGRLRAR
jgi:phosphohistidine phosphatase SixA